MAEPKRIYLDWAATTPLCPEAARAMEPFFAAGLDNLPYGANPNSLHTEGRTAFAKMQKARESLTQAVGARPDEVVFTSGATESNFLALVGLVEALQERRRKKGLSEEVHIIASAIEHGAIVEAARFLSHRGVAVDYAPVDQNGVVQPSAVEALLRPETVLVSVMAANNEVGTIEPIGQLAELAHGAGALMHTDAAQAFGKILFDCHVLGVDAASFSGHKVCGPKGIGALYLRSGVPFAGPVTGGGQEGGRRGGTQNVSAMAGFAAAAQALAGDSACLEAERKRLSALRDRLYGGMCRHACVVASVDCPSESSDFLPNVANVCVKGFESETLILRLDMAGFAVAGGSACSSHSLEPSRILLALGLARDMALGSLRVSVGRDTSEQDIDEFLAAFDQVVAS